MKISPDRPLVLCLSGHDPGGGAGLQADIETLAANGTHSLGVITAMTVQDSHNVWRVIATDPALMREQIDCLLADMQPAAIKIGLIGDAAQLPVILDAIHRCAVPVICDPVLRAGGGKDLADAGLVSTFLSELLANVTLLTPNAAEARRLAPQAADLDDCARVLIEAGCANVLITGGNEPGLSVVNTWHGRDKPAQRFEWPRLPETFHGAGCTLASAIAARIALGDEMAVALRSAQAWTQGSLAKAFRIGQGRRIPGRIQT